MPHIKFDFPSVIKFLLRLSLCLFTLTACSVYATEYHVSPAGTDGNDGSESTPFKTISAAAAIARPGDVVTVHEGVYRERVDPPRGGTSDHKRVVYQAAIGETAVVKGSEVVKGWKKAGNDTWTVTIPNSFFGDFNPYQDLINGDWFDPMGREHHTGAVYFNGHWLTEAAQLEHVLQPVGQAGSLYAPGSGGALLNVAWLQPGKAGRVEASSFAAQQGIQKASCSEGGECIGWIEQGDWVRYEQVDLGEDCRQIEFRAASATRGGIIEIHLDAADGQLLGSCVVPDTGGWQSWSSFQAKIKPASGIKTLCLVFRGPQSRRARDLRLWFAQVDDASTTIWAQFQDVNPNEDQVEINVRQTVFYPGKPSIDFITVRGFTLEHAATPWAPPTAEQIGLIGTHWSKGWIIEENTIRYSTCTGVTLGKHGDEFDNTSQNSAEGYVKTIERALARGWSRENIGHHVVRNNHIFHCEQAGIVGSMGPVFSLVTGNTIHDINYRGLFGGAEMAGIKFHGAIDSIISNNHIYRSGNFGIWLDWMTQGTRVTGNLLHDNRNSDLFLEVNHGPFLVDNNIALSKQSLLINSQGGAYVHNLFAGNVHVIHQERRRTPYHPAHATDVADLALNPSGDDRYYNNLFVGHNGLTPYDSAELPVFMHGNVFLAGARASKHEPNPTVQPQVDTDIELIEQPDGMYVRLKLDQAWLERQRPLVTTKLLGKAKIPDLPYVQPDDMPYRIDTDYFGRNRSKATPTVGPFENPGTGSLELKVWPKDHPGQ